MRSFRFVEWIGRNLRAANWTMMLMLLVLVVGAYLFVYMTGGTKFVFSHSMYIPVLLSGLIFGSKGGIFFGLLGGIALGPFMPIDVTTGEAQKSINWLYRTGFFVLIGLLSGIASDYIKSYLRQLKWIFTHDASTQLPNQIALFDELASLAGGKKVPVPLCLIVNGIENILELKSAFGPNISDYIIPQMAQRLTSALPGGCRIYRTDSEQIAVLVVNNGPQKLLPLFDKMTQACQEPFEFNDLRIHVDSRMGHVAFNQMEEKPEAYLQRAELALVEAFDKAQGNVAYDPAILKATKENLSMLGELQNAVREGHLTLHYQPKISLTDGLVASAEALMRWHHPEQGNIPPGLFIPRAEKSTLIHLITEFALNQSMSQMAHWKESGLHLPIAVNISTRNLVQPGFVDLVMRLLDQYKLNGEWLELEVTESALMMDMQRSIKELTRIAEAKIIVSIDDFGTGYSSLQYLHDLPISLLKIDQSFVRRLPDDIGAVHIIETATSLAMKMNIQSIAEGVESKEIYDMLRNIGCDMAQGYYISRPMPPEKFADWYMQNGAYVNGPRI